MPPHKSHRSEGFHPALEACGGPKDLGGSEAQTHVGTEEPDRPSHEGRRQLPRTAGVQSKPPWDGSESERGRSGAAGTLGVTHGDRD